MNNQTGVYQPRLPRKTSSGKKTLVGCIIGCAVLAFVGALSAGVIYVGKYALMQKIAQFETQLTSLGFTSIYHDTSLVVEGTPAPHTMFKAINVCVTADCPSSVAIIAMNADIYGTMEGMVYFRGKKLTIHPKAQLKGGLEAVAMTIVTNGLVRAPFRSMSVLGGPANVLGAPVQKPRASG